MNLVQRTAVTDRPYRQPASHSLSLITARAWVKDDILGPEFGFGATAYNRWQFTLERWVTLRIKEGHLTAAKLIQDLVKAGERCRAVGTSEAAERVARLWVRCHDEAGVACEDCR